MDAHILMPMGSIYCITHTPTGRRYIGKANNHKRRWKQHIQNASPSLISSAIQHHGVSEFHFEVIETVPNDCLSEREQYWIEHYQTEVHGFNNMRGISAKLWVTEEERQYGLDPYYKPKGYFDV